MNNKLRIFGFIIALAYIIVILSIWISAEYNGYIYFAAGEPNRLILYTEWIFGGIALIVLSIEYLKSTTEKTKVIYDPLV